MKRKALLVMVLALAVGLLSMPITACRASVKLSEMTMATGIDQSTFKPIDKTSTFSSDTAEIFLSARFVNAPTNTEITSNWIYVSGEVADLQNYTIDTTSLTVSGTDYLYFSMPKPETGWPKGNYKVVLSLNGKEQGSVSFKVQ